MFDIAIQNTYTLDAERVVDLLITAFEGGSNHWIDHVTPQFSYDQEDVEVNWYSTIPFMERDDWIIKITDVEGDEHTVTKEVMRKGFEYLAEQHLSVLESIVEEDYDADDADIWLQLVVYRVVVYG